MPRAYRSKIQLSEEEKKRRRREQKKLSMRRARAKMSRAEIEERRKQDKERYKKKKAEGLIKTINDLTPRQQRNVRKVWREKAKIRREKVKQQKALATDLISNTPSPSSSYSARSRVSVGKAIRARHVRQLKAENKYLRIKITNMDSALIRYRMQLSRLNRKLKCKSPVRAICNQKKVENSEEIRRAIHMFLTEDENSRLTAGKKDTITRHKIKKQIRLLNDSLLNLHKQFVQKIGMKISYETFRRNRPFWVLFPKVGSRNTCLCAMHTNVEYLVQAFRTNQIFTYKSATDLIKHLCCNDSLKVVCLERKCANCFDKTIITTDFNDNDTISYEKWLTKNVVIVSKGQTKTVKKTVKERLVTTKRALFQTFNSMLPNFMKHVANMIHQMKSIKNIKQQLMPSQGLLHIDFSENYICKYGHEIQAVHFGGSKAQLSLHTCVYYYTESEPPENYVKTSSFCTLSENLRHDPVLISVHLQTLAQKIRELSPNLNHLFIVSDGPLTQYRNKSMFHLIATYLNKVFEVNTLTWNYSEKGHGKGAPDGVGGCVKRIADDFIAKGNDIYNLDCLITCLHEKCKGIQVYKIDEASISEVESVLDLSTTHPFKGTLEIHQVTWSIDCPLVLQVRRLSCLICTADMYCSHYGIGQIKVQIKTLDSPRALLVENSGSNSPEVEHLPEPRSPEIPASPNASTVSMSPGFSDRLTPDAGILYNREPCRPIKRALLIYSDSDSDCSISFISKKPSKSIPLNYSDDSDSSLEIFPKVPN